MNDSSDWEIQKNTIFQDTIFDLYTLPQLICTQTLLKHIRARCNKICQRKEKDGIYPPLAIFCRSCVFFSSEKEKSQPSCMSGKKFLHYKSFLCCQLFWGPGQVIYPCYLTFSICIMRTKTLVDVIWFL